jgi:hypothetical protein
MSFRTLRDWVRNHDRRTDLRRAPHAYAYALDCRGRNRTPGYWDSVRGKSDASKRLCGITFPACNCPKVNHSGFLGPTCGKLEYDETHI